MSKIAVVLFNLGGPDSKKAIEPFLFNFFTDPNIIRLPYPLRWLLARMISRKRSKKEAGFSYGELGDKSPLLENSTAQADALQTLLNAQEMTGDQYRTFVCMRYWHPMADEIVKGVKTWGADEIILLPLYPQFSTTTTRSSFQEWTKACKKHGLNQSSLSICCYPFDKGFLKANADNLRATYDRAFSETGQKPRILMSAHGLPEKIIQDGDPYQWQCEQSAAKIIEASSIDAPDWQICYQSRVGRLVWIGPSTDEALRQAGADKVPVVILPHAFTQEHVETLVEIEIEYRHLAHENGVPGFYRVPTPGVHPAFIEGLSSIVRNGVARARGGDGATTSDEGARLCPCGFARCPAL